jgi:antitoxin component YwqK of YwqJK toxin-antitoxin module
MKELNKMLFNILIAIFIFSNKSVSAQESGKLMFFKVLENDTIDFFLNDVGDITIQSKAKYIRKASIDKNGFNYVGKIVDQVMNGKINYYCTYIGGSINGQVLGFYDNGILKYQGTESNSIKDSVWTFYYPNGQKEKVIQFNFDTLYLKEYYQCNGKPVFIDGNGKYKGRTISGFKQNDEYTISGNIKKGKIDGKWNWQGNGSSATEYFDEGKFIKGSSYGLIYYKDPKVSLLGFDWHEHVDIFKFIAIPFSSEKEMLFSQMLKYKGNNNLNKTFLPEFKIKLNDIIKINNLENFWCLVQFVVTQDNKVTDILVHSNNAILEKQIPAFLESLRAFETVKPGDKPVDCGIYLSFFSTNGVVTYPEYNFSTSLDIMNLLPNK